MTTNFTYPTPHWSAEDAEMIIQFLDDLKDALCNTYGPEIVEQHRQILEQERLEREEGYLAPTDHIDTGDF